jgi:hypothetical protein
MKNEINVKSEIIRIIAKLDNGSHSSNQLQGIDETLTAIFYAHLKELKNQIIEKSTFEPGTSSNGWYQIYKDDLDSIL